MLSGGARKDRQSELTMLSGISAPRISLSPTSRRRHCCHETAFWWKLGLSGMLVLLGGVFAGLTLGLMGLDLVNLQGQSTRSPKAEFITLCGLRADFYLRIHIVLSTSGDEQERKDATKVMRLLERGRHWVLVVLLLSNVVVNESLREFAPPNLRSHLEQDLMKCTPCSQPSSSTVSSAAASEPSSSRRPSSSSLVKSSRSVRIPGLVRAPFNCVLTECASAAICARYGLRIGAVAAPFVLALMYIEFPIAYPIAKLLDRLLGEEQGVTYKKAELKTFVGLHRQFGEETLNDDEVTIISSVLELGDKSVAQIMTPLEDIYSLPVDTKLSQTVVDQILASGHSRIPIHAPGNPTDFVGMLSELRCSLGATLSVSTD